MLRTRLNLFVLLALVTLTASAADPTLPQLFTQAKDLFAKGDFKRSLAEFDRLDAASQKPGFEKDRAQLVPVITFYRGANLAALGRKDEAKEAFITYLGYTPNAAIQSPPYPKATVELFDAARKEAAGRSGSLASAYAKFVTPPTWSLAADEQWHNSPVRLLLTSAEHSQYAGLSTSAEREAFVTKFWNELDPTPGTPANEFRSEFERRVAFADTYFGAAKVRGRDTDRASVLAVFGVPSFASMSQISSGADAMNALRSGGNTQALGSSIKSGNDVQIGRAGSGSTVETDAAQGVKEGWVYRSDRMPAGVAYKELRFDFVTKEGYGSGVMQKNAEPVQALNAAALAARRNKKLN
ncbi:MAG TPA: GWxTD domain-containing protein [Thermoanaerobaculia bacterium]